MYYDTIYFDSGRMELEAQKASNEMGVDYTDRGAPSK
jgi:hypothetical protein